MRHSKTASLWLLKLIGVWLFVWILSRIDQHQLLKTIKAINVPLFALSFCLQYVLYIPKTHRWHTLVRSTGYTPTWHESWKLFNIGIFLATVTPAKLGEFGRAAYLRKHGVPTATGVSLGIIDRFADVIAIGILAVAGIIILFSWKWAAALTALGCVCAAIGYVLFRKTKDVSFLTFAHSLSPAALRNIALSTIIGWIVYFAWAVLVARSLGIDVALPVLVSCFTITGIIALMPVAPSGFGTRDAALITLLVPYGVNPENAVALAFLMFVSILGSAVLGGWYYVRSNGVTE